MESAVNAMSPPASGVTIAELPPTTRVSVRLADPAAGPGLDLPSQVGARRAAGGRTALCLGPDEWLVEAPESDRDALLATLQNLPGPLSAVEVSDREVTVALEGPAVLDLLAAGCPLDLAKMPVGNGTRTVFDTVQVVLTREAENRFNLSVWRSFAPHVRALLDIAGRELAAGL
jgi:sarcosine oxidase subunit gamma